MTAIKKRARAGQIRTQRTRSKQRRPPQEALRKRAVRIAETGSPEFTAAFHCPGCGEAFEPLFELRVLVLDAPVGLNRVVCHRNRCTITLALDEVVSSLKSLLEEDGAA